MNFKIVELESALLLELQDNLIELIKDNPLIETVQEALDKGVRNVAVDLTKVEYVNSAGLTLLLMLLTKCRNRDGELLLINPTAAVKKLLITTKLEAIFPIMENRADALDFFQKQDKHLMDN